LRDGRFESTLTRALQKRNALILFLLSLQLNITGDTMERRSFLKKSAVGGAAVAAVAAPAIVGAQPAVRWRLSSSFPKSLDTLYGVSEVFSKKVQELTNGKFVISTHAAGEITPAFGVVDALQQGSIEAASTAPYYFHGKDETFALDCAVPFGMNSRQMSAWYFEGNGQKLMRDFYKQYNIIHFAMGNTGAQMGGWYRKEIKTVEDLKGLKMRIGGFAGRVAERIGIVSQNIPGGEIYSALEKGTIDAAEWVGPYDDEKLGFNKVANNYYYPGWWEGGPQLTLYCNTKAFDALPADYKAAIEVASAYAHVDMQAKYDYKNPAALRRLIGSGTKVQRFPKPVMDAAFKAANELYAELSAKNANFKKVHDDYMKARNDMTSWFRFAEAGFDDFMQAQRLG
jgi:TRAP-type mannitol/chloroaromatic compound transport system substrate-binding protein